MSFEYLTLYDLNRYIRETIEGNFESEYWIVAEISELKINVSGHCYLELIEKDSESENIIARAKATIWNSTFKLLRIYFETTTGVKLSAGIKILVKVKVTFHELYGYSLNITDIEPTYTLGDIARKKQEIIKRLKEEGIFDNNKQLEFPILPKKIAVISSTTAAGYGDFYDQLTNNTYGYKFFIKLFPAIMQGEESEKSILSALDRIEEFKSFFDIVVIIRGGGAQAELECFNSYWLARRIALFPLPILTGIGHEQDETIIDLTAHKRLKTPTAVAEFIISTHHEFKELLINYTIQLKELISNKINKEKKFILKTYSLLINKGQYTIKMIINKYNSMLKNINLKTQNVLQKNQKQIEIIKKSLKFIAIQKIKKENNKLLKNYEHLKLNVFNNSKFSKRKIEDHEKTISILNPENIMKRGYSITTQKNQIIKSIKEINEEIPLKTYLVDGKLLTKIIDIIDNKTNNV